jgi:ABC-type phosphate transport system substrate-binding protein
MYSAVQLAAVQLAELNFTIVSCTANSSAAGSNTVQLAGSSILLPAVQMAVSQHSIWQSECTLAVL